MRRYSLLAFVLPCTVSAGAGALIVVAVLNAQPHLGLVMPSSASTAAPSPSEHPAYPGYTGMLDSKLPVGELARDFTATEIASGLEVRLSDFRGQKPVVLIFASSSTAYFYDQADRLEALYQTHRGQAEFLFMHIRQARVASSTQPTGDREEQVRQAVADLKLTIPCVLDNRFGDTESRYLAWPQRLVIVDVDGRIALDAGRGMPDGWDLAKVEAWLTGHRAQPSPPPDAMSDSKRSQEHETP
jgi:hypothetical protein